MATIMNSKLYGRPNPVLFTALFFLLIAILIFAVVSLAAPPNSRQVTTTKSQVENNGVSEQTTPTTTDSPLDKLTAWEILWMCDWFTWPFIFITVVGVAILAYRALLEYQQKARAQGLLMQSIETTNLSQFVKHLNMSQASRASQLFNHMISTFNKTKRAEPLHEDVNHFVQGEKDSFETFNRVMGFLSDSAGALGLLGTVWGIFVTFYAGKMDGPTILKGMSIALITTLVGLIISLLFNTGVTTLFALFNRQLKLLGERAEELRQAMLHLQIKSAQNSNGHAQERPEPVKRVRPMEMPRKTPQPELIEEEVEEWA